MTERKETVNEEKINTLIEKSLQEIDNFSEIGAVKKKYLEKEGIIFQLFQQISQEKNLEQKKKLGNLVNNWKSQLVAKVKELEKKLKGQNQKKGWGKKSFHRNDFHLEVDKFFNGYLNIGGNFEWLQLSTAIIFHQCSCDF